jgi:hypothetical protein
MPYEVDDRDGRCLYRGDDLELACEIHDQVQSARLRHLTDSRHRASAGGLRTPPTRPAGAEHATH